MHQNICILVSGDSKDDAINSATQYMEDNAVDKFCDYFSYKPIKVISHGKEFNETLYNYIKERLTEYRVAKSTKNTAQYHLEFKYRAICEQMKILIGLPYCGVSFADADEYLCKLSAYKRKLMKENPEQYYLVIFDYHF